MQRVDCGVSVVGEGLDCGISYSESGRSEYRVAGV